MLEFSIFLAILLPFFYATKKATQTAVDEPTQTATEEPKKMTSLNIEKDDDEETDDTTIITTTKSKDPVPPSPLPFVTAQDRDIDRLIDELMEIDKEGEEMNPKKWEWRYKVSAHKSTRRAK
ncbi:hypothetical protein J1N35_043667 [Gossypium stocksii]|uniref:Uncharacterized protein n=1 Tax=Gossypium stocksii TaxID=47602 RepID=A0A9D3ZFN7_9ROSI|nr:hypothetical protein J1N35_043667 [Gossypium stocksii]